MSGGSRVVVYLDQNHWVNLLRRVTKNEADAVSLRDRLVELRTSGDICVVLSASNYLETWHRGAEGSRHALAGLMRDVTDYATVAPFQVLEASDITDYLARLTGRPRPRRPPVFGRGVNHAFGSDTGRFRLVEWIYEDDRGEGPPAPRLDGFDDAIALGDAWEWFNLAGPDSVVHMDGIEVGGQHRIGTSNLARETALRDYLRARPELRGRMREIFVKEEVVRITDTFNDACEELGLDPFATFMWMEPPHGPAAMAEVVPTTNVLSTLRWLQHRNFQLPLEQHDVTDLSSLAVAVPYCDLVVTEKRWAHAVNVSGLATQYGTTVLGSTNELFPALAGHHE